MTWDQWIACAASVATCLSFFYLIGKSFKDDILERIEKSENTLVKRIDRLDEKVEDIDRRLCRMEGAFSSRDFCGLRTQSDRKVD